MLQAASAPDSDHLPTAQFKQVATEMAATVVENFPGKHDSHVETNEADVALEYLPATKAVFTPPLQ